MFWELSKQPTFSNPPVTLLETLFVTMNRSSNVQNYEYRIRMYGIIFKNRNKPHGSRLRVREEAPSNSEFWSLLSRPTDFYMSHDSTCKVSCSRTCTIVASSPICADVLASGLNRCGSRFRSITSTLRQFKSSLKHHRIANVYDGARKLSHLLLPWSGYSE